MKGLRFVSFISATTLLIAIVPLVSSPTTYAAPKLKPSVRWVVTLMQPSRNYKLSSLVSTKSTGKKTWKVTGSCTLSTNLVKTKRSGTCRVTVNVASNNRYSSVSSARSFSLSSSTTTGSTTPPTSIPTVVDTTTTVPATTTSTTIPPTTTTVPTTTTTTTVPVDPVLAATATQTATFPERGCLHSNLGDTEYDKVITGQANNSHRAALGNCLVVFGASAPTPLPSGSAAALAVSRSRDHFNSMPTTTNDRFNIVINPSTPAWLEVKIRSAILGTSRFYGESRLPSVDIIVGTNDEWTAEEIALYLYGSRTTGIESARHWAQFCTAPDTNDNMSGCALASNDYVNPNDPNGRRWNSYPVLIMGYGARLQNHRWHDSSASSTTPHELSHIVQWLSNGTATDRATRLEEFNAVEGTCQYSQCDSSWFTGFQSSLLEGQSTFFGAVIADIIGQDRYQDPFNQYRGAMSPTMNPDMAHYLWVNYPTSYWQGGDAGYFDPRYYVTGLGTELMVAQFGVEKTLAFQKALNFRFWYDTNASCNADPCPVTVSLVGRQASEFQRIFGVSIGSWMTTAQVYISRRHAGQYPTLADVGLTQVP